MEDGILDLSGRERLGFGAPIVWGDAESRFEGAVKIDRAGKADAGCYEIICESRIPQHAACFMESHGAEYILGWGMTDVLEVSAELAFRDADFRRYLVQSRFAAEVFAVKCLRLLNSL